MANVLYLVHRIPYPPNKGDKLRSYHLLRALAAEHRVFLGTLVDDPADMAHVNTLRSMCVDVCALPLRPVSALLRSAWALVTRDPITLHHFRNAALSRWVARTVQNQGIQRIVAVSSAMAPYALAHPAVPLVMDFVDTDSAKWAQYAATHPLPMRWIYAREASRLAMYERQVAANAERCVFATSRERDLFLLSGPEPHCAVEVLDNGVDTDHFAPDPQRLSPFVPGETALVFTGTMSHWPNVDAVLWFARDVLPALRQRRPGLRLHVVGRAPSPALQAAAANAGAGLVLTGAVDDVRPWLQHAAVVVAPVRLARGVQNKVLEGLAMGRPLVTSSDCAGALGAQPGAHLLTAGSATEYQQAVETLLDAPSTAAAMGQAARLRMQQAHAWPQRLAGVRTWFERTPASVAAAYPPNAVTRLAI